jgi:hypothetical protein
MENSENSMFLLDDSTKAKWYKIIFDLKKQFGKKPDMNGILFLIGVRELGQVREFSKQEKMDLMHISTCKLLSYEGYYAFEYSDEDGWPHYRMLKKPPYTDLLSQENRLKKLIVTYFQENGLLDLVQPETP